MVTLENIIYPHMGYIFFSTKGSSGTGLGLSVIQKIIAEHGGAVAVDSQEGEWTEFTIVLPAADALRAASSEGGAATVETA